MLLRLVENLDGRFFRVAAHNCQVYGYYEKHEMLKLCTSYYPCKQYDELEPFVYVNNDTIFKFWLAKDEQ